MERWVEETLHRGFRVRLKADRVLFDSDTEHQRLIIFENSDFGRVMMLDGIVQVATKDEFVYHEMMAHVPLFAHGQVRKALIIGGGDGGVLRESLKHPELESITLCEIDRSVIDLCREHFPEVSAISTRCLPTPSPISPARHRISAGPCPSAGAPTIAICGIFAKTPSSGA